MPRPDAVALVERDQGQVVQRGRRPWTVAQTTPYRQGFAEVVCRLPVLALSTRQQTQIVEYRRHTPMVLLGAENRQRRRILPQGFLEVAIRIRQHAQVIEGCCLAPAIAQPQAQIETLLVGCRRFIEPALPLCYIAQPAQSVRGAGFVAELSLYGQRGLEVRASVGVVPPCYAQACRQ